MRTWPARMGNDHGVPTTGSPTTSGDAHVLSIATTPIKGLALTARAGVYVDVAGIADDRAYFLVDERGHMINGKALGQLSVLQAEITDDFGAMWITFPDGQRVGGEVALGATRPVRFFRSEFDAPVVDGPWGPVLSDYCGRPITVCRAPQTRPGVDRGLRGAISLMSAESLEALTTAGRLDEAVDGRRFRMTFTVAGAGPHGEDGWCGQEIAIGAATLRINGLVGRCSVTTRNPDSGEVDLPTLHILKAYRGEVQSGEGLPFGVYGEVVVPGEVVVGDPVRVLDGNRVDFE
jgi:uncharacterized protein YcbX